jgi:hypothetical protein
VKVENFKTFLKINMWSNFLQLIRLSIMGFSYYIALGVNIVLVYSYDESQKLTVGLNYFSSSFGIN